MIGKLTKQNKKRKFLSAYPDLPVTVLDDEVGPQKISEKLCEDSLFGGGSSP